MRRTFFLCYKECSFVVLMLLCATFAYAQKGNSVSGIVKDTSGEPLIGVSVLETGTTNGIITDINGKYTLVLTKDKSSLQFSYIGYGSQTIPVNSRKDISVVLKDDAIGLNEVVVTGYGKTVTKDKLTAAISKVSSEVLERGVRSNPLTALAGTVTGVRVTQTSGQPGAGPSIQVRAGAALDGTGSPLYIIDGVQKGNLNDINSNDIESIEVLKDAAATALYGARANNGVVLVTTKTGRVGKTSITLNVNVGKNFARDNYHFMNATDYLYWERMAANRSGDNMNSSLGWGTGHDVTHDGNKVETGVYSTTFLTDDNRFLLDYGWMTMVDPVTGKDLLYKETSLRDINMQEAWTQDYNLSFSGGNEKGKFYSSIGYYDEAGFPKESGYKRLSFNLNGEYKIKNWLTASGFLNFSRAETNPNYMADGNFWSVVAAAPPTFKGTNLDGTIIEVVNNNQNANWNVMKDYYYRRNTTYKTTIGTSFKVDLMKGLSLKLNGMWYLYMTEKESFNKVFPNGTGKFDTKRAASASYARGLDQTYNAILNYNASFGDHNVSAVGGFEMIDKYNFGLAASGQGATSDDFIGLQYSTINPATTSMSTTHTQERIMSGFINASYDYKGKYLLSFSGRYDGYSRLVDNRWGFFPGISAAWNVFREDFMEKQLDTFSNLKIRMGYGQNGNVNGIGLYDLQGNYGNTADFNTNYGILINKLPYPGLRWEKTTSFDAAVELGLFNKVDLSLGYFNKKTSDLIASVPLPTSSGVGNMLTNNGSLRSQGMEFEVNYRIIDNKDLKWSVGANVTYVKSKILKLPNNGNENNRQGGQQIYKGQGSNEKIWVGGIQEGQSYGDIYGFQIMHIIRDEADLQNYAYYTDVTTKKPVYGPEAYAQLTVAQQQSAQKLAPGDAVWYDVNGDGTIDSYDQVKLGNSVPKWMGGFNTSVTWKGLTLFARFDYALGYKKWNGGLQYFMAINSGHFNVPELAKETWTEDNRDAKLPVLMTNDANFKQNFSHSNSSLFWENASYMCAREISLSYDLPTMWVKQALMEKVTVTLTGQNLFYVTGSRLYSPEYGTTASDKGGYALPKSLLMGLKVVF
ncbi:SusC/RagA family TonB-linked outer membrane protein [Bacteroides ovatus]|uniref:TonB-linked outer membrane protein, SusC/RagA family n=1 Tax=Bacteroides ovatus TaxID=28116 RepID=A0A1G8FAK2_BACOV|nr:TonB-dependent receptor [Bacteroides ovatus]SDH79166.1 TonB-linked outer membrane protein, SusC/RagA family [Bacteroides ovatus]